MFAACSLDVQRPQATLWEGELQATGEGPSLTGSVAAVSRESTTETGIQVSGGQAGDRWRWSLREGTCDSPGTMVASAEAYPVIEAEEQTDPEAPAPVAKATGETVLPTALDSDAAYHAIVAADSAPATTLACGDLTQG